MDSASPRLPRRCSSRQGLVGIEYFFAANLSTVDAVTLPSKIAAEVSSQGAKYWTMAAIATTAIAPLLVVGILLERYIVKGLTAGAVK
jgi:multiple sugar transport system permease protein